MIKSAQVLNDADFRYQVFAQHPERVILDLTVRVSQVLEGTVADGDTVSEPALDLTIKQDLCHIMLVVVFLLVFGDEDNPGEVVHVPAVLSDYCIGLLSLHWEY